MVVPIRLAPTILAIADRWGWLTAGSTSLWLSGGPAAVEGDGRPGDVTGVRRAQPHHQGSDVLGLDELLDRGPLEEDLGDDVRTRDVVLGGLGVDLAVDERGADVTRVHAVAGDAVFGPFERGDLREAF